MFRELLVVGLALASLGFAQRGGGGGRGGGDMDTGGAPMMTAAPTRWDTISNSLNLTRDQKKTVRTMLDEGNKEAAPLRDELAKTRAALAEALQAKTSDNDTKPAVDAYAAAAAQMSHLEMKTFAKIITSLDENQKANRAGLAIVFNLMNGIFRNKNWNED
ncbi:MAG TPA: hypothetical protein VLY04_22060 [Bryobacteraceae bacterium]|nr:hypothetical protein [Bryobacteraceae bacterium]